MGEVLAQEQAELGVPLSQQRQGLGQQERRHRRDHPQAEAPCQRLAGAVGGLHEVLRAGQDLVAPAHGVLADGGEDHARAGAVDHRRAQHLLQLLDAGRKGGLSDVRGVGGAAEGAVLGQELQVMQLPEGGEHGFV